MKKSLNNKKVFYVLFLIVAFIFFYLFFVGISYVDCARNRSQNETDESDEAYFYKTKNHVCYGYISAKMSPPLYGTKVIKTADLNTFEYLGVGYAKDKNRVYYDYAYRPCAECLIKDVDIERGIEGADPKTFKLLTTPGYAKDKYYIYKNGRIIGDSQKLNN